MNSIARGIAHRLKTIFNEQHTPFPIHADQIHSFGTDSVALQIFNQKGRCALRIAGPTIEPEFLGSSGISWGFFIGSEWT
ncbi:MAG: hypothetical protein JXQ71_14790 [Verrucomicrobia bacterium]|nr:hypothetical protein [Verrucomicrobiota bacterium]